MEKKGYFCSHCNDYVSRGTRSNHLKELAEANGSSYDTDDSESFEASVLENNDSDGINNRGCSYDSDGQNTCGDPETTRTCFMTLDDADRRLFDEAFIRKSFVEPEDLNESLFCEQGHTRN